MTTTDDRDLHDDLDEGSPTMGPSPVESLQDRLRRAAQAEITDATLDLDVPGWPVDTQLVVRYRALGFEESRRVEEKAQKMTGRDAMLKARIDYLLAACEEVMVRDTDGNPIPLPGGPMVFDQRLADLLGWDQAQTQGQRRTILNLVFKKNWAAITGQYAELLGWLQTRAAEDEERLQGNSPSDLT